MTHYSKGWLTLSMSGFLSFFTQESPWGLREELTPHFQKSTFSPSSPNKSKWEPWPPSLPSKCFRYVLQILTQTVFISSQRYRERGRKEEFSMTFMVVSVAVGDVSRGRGAVIFWNVKKIKLISSLARFIMNRLSLTRIVDAIISKWLQPITFPPSRFFRSLV